MVLETSFYSLFFICFCPDFVSHSNESIAFFLKATQTDKPSQIIFGWLGSAYFNVGQYDKAEEYFVKGLEIEPKDWFCLISLANTCLKTQRIPEAKALVQKALAYDSTNAAAYGSIGEIYDDNGLYAEAEAAHLKSLSLDSLDAISWFFLGRLYLHSNRLADAEQALKKSLAIDPKLWDSWVKLGQVHLKAGRYEEARRAFAVPLELYPENPLTYVHLALLAAAEGKTAEALDFTEKAFQKGMRFEAIYADPEYDFAPVRGLPGFKVLEKKYFPNKVKD